jgi:hypothetical protein
VQEAAAAGLVWPGFQSYGVATGVLENDQVIARLSNHEGTGRFLGFANPEDEFTPPALYFDPENDRDEFVLSAGIHVHMNSAFTEDGMPPVAALPPVSEESSSSESPHALAMVISVVGAFRRSRIAVRAGTRLWSECYRSGRALVNAERQHHAHRVRALDRRGPVDERAVRARGSRALHEQDIARAGAPDAGRIPNYSGVGLDGTQSRVAERGAAHVRFREPFGAGT